MRLDPLMLMSAPWVFDSLDHLGRAHGQRDALPSLQKPPGTNPAPLQGSRRQATLGHPGPGLLGYGDREILRPLPSKVEIRALLALADASHPPFNQNKSPDPLPETIDPCRVHRLIAVLSPDTKALLAGLLLDGQQIGPAQGVGRARIHQGKPGLD